MIFLLVFVCIAFAVWILKIHPARMDKKTDHMDDFTCPAPEGLTKEMLMEALRTNLYYPGFKNCYYDEEGNIVLVCREGKHIVQVSENRVFVQPLALILGKQRRMRYAQEAEALTAYIWKMFDSTAPVNGYQLYQKITYSKVGLAVAIATIAVAACIVVSTAISYYQKHIQPSIESSGYTDTNYTPIQDSYYTEYSTRETIGEAFDHFFDDGEWEYYSAGTEDFCTFTGSRVESEMSIELYEITFKIENDKFWMHKMKIDDQDVWESFWGSKMKQIFSKENWRDGQYSSSD